MRKYMILLLLVFLIFGCSKTTVKTDEGDMTITQKGDQSSVVIESDDGDTKIEAKTGADDWCGEGGEWKMTGDDGSAKMVVLGIEDSGKYKGYCHVKYDIDTEEQAKIDYYFDEEGNGYQVMDVNGQKIEMEWTK